MKKQVIGLSITVFLLWKIILNLSHFNVRKFEHYSTPADSNINIITYNTQSLLFRYKNVNLLHTHLKEFDIILLQECFADIYLTKKTFLKAFDGYNIIAETSPNLFSKKLLDSGLVILSKFPILDYTFTPFTTGIYVDALANKGFIHIKINIRSEIYHFINLHIQASYSPDIKDAIDVKLKQLNEIRNYIRKNKLTENIIIGGDFNIDIKGKYSTILQNLFEDYNFIIPEKPTHCVLYKNYTEVDTRCTKDVEYIPYAFDFFIVNRNKDNTISKKVHTFDYYSDHCGFSMHFKN